MAANLRHLLRLELERIPRRWRFFASLLLLEEQLTLIYCRKGLFVLRKNTQLLVEIRNGRNKPIFFACWQGNALSKRRSLCLVIGASFVRLFSTIGQQLREVNLLRVNSSGMFVHFSVSNRKKIPVQLRLGDKVNSFRSGSSPVQFRFSSVSAKSRTGWKSWIVSELVTKRFVVTVTIEIQ